MIKPYIYMEVTTKNISPHEMRVEMDMERAVAISEARTEKEIEFINLLYRL